MKIFVLVSRVPYPLEKGDKLRAYHQVEHLSKTHEIHLCCLSVGEVHPDALIELQKIAQHVTIVPLKKWKIYLRLARALMSEKPFQVHYFFQKAAQLKVLEAIEAFQPDHIYCQLIRTSEYVKNLHGIPKTLDYMDALNKGMERQTETASALLAPVYRAESQRLVKYEHLIFEYFEHHTIISKQDQQLIYHPQRNKIRVIPNGVDTEFFQKRAIQPTHELVFTGNMSYAPNVDSAKYLVHEILPLVHQQIPGVRLLLAGANPNGTVLGLAGRYVNVSGWLEDIRDAYSSARVFIAPMRIGTGLQNKLLEAMSMQLPCISSALANNALGATPDEHILIGDSPQSYANQVVVLLKDANLSGELAQYGRRFVAANFSWESTVEELSTLMSAKSAF
jgi:polysaccharide biosynthesis protein PslH